MALNITLLVLLVLGITINVVSGCGLLERCPTGQACVDRKGQNLCVKYAQRGQLCSVRGLELPLIVTVYQVNPPCDPNQKLVCRQKGAQLMCMKQ